MTISTIAILLVVSCALAFSGADVFRKLLTHWMRPVPLLFALAAGMTPAFALWYVYLQAPTPSLGYWVPGLGSTGLNVASNLAFLEAVRRSPLSLTIPLLSLTPVFTTILAIPLLGELPTGAQWLGIAAVVVGAFWLSLGSGDEAPRRAGRAFFREPGSRLMVIVALLWSLAMPLDKMAVLESDPSFHGLVLSAGVALALLVLAVGRRSVGEFRDLRQRPLLLALGIALSVLAVAFQLLSIRVVWVGFVETMKRGIGSLLALIWGRLVFGESFRADRLAAVALMGAGVALILLQHE